MLLCFYLVYLVVSSRTFTTIFSFFFFFFFYTWPCKERFSIMVQCRQGWEHHRSKGISCSLSSFSALSNQKRTEHDNNHPWYSLAHQLTILPQRKTGFLVKGRSGKLTHSKALLPPPLFQCNQDKMVYFSTWFQALLPPSKNGCCLLNTKAICNCCRENAG